jgi:hypothetical protein
MNPSLLNTWRRWMPWGVFILVAVWLIVQSYDVAWTLDDAYVAQRTLLRRYVDRQRSETVGKPGAVLREADQKSPW